MYLSLILFPFLSFFTTIVFARFLSAYFVIRLNLIGLLTAIILSFIVFYEVVLNKTVCVVELGC